MEIELAAGQSVSVGLTVISPDEGLHAGMGTTAVEAPPGE